MIKYENDCVGCDVCINCGAYNKPHYYCNECGTEIGFADEMYDYDDETHYHINCWYEHLGYSDSLTLENAEKYGEKDTKTIELNGFWADIFTPDEIEELIKREYLEGRSQEEIREDIETYAEWDKEAWIHAVL